MPETLNRVVCGALGGLLGIAAWIPTMRLDQRLTQSPFDDVTLLGTLMVRDERALTIGLVLHAFNGALFGAAYALLAEGRLTGPGWRRGLIAATTECVITNFGTPLLDSVHPGIRTGRTGRTATPVAIAQSFWRHAVFGLVLGATYEALRGTSASLSGSSEREQRHAHP
jgi:hypothetical protein